MDKPIIARREVTNHILHTFKLKADKRLGQNFLIDEEVVRRIVAAAELSEDDTVLEVGPGIGTLTQGLAPLCASPCVKVIFNLLEQRLPMERLVAMVQKEVAERMVAKPGGKDYGALSVSIQYYTESEIAFIVPPESFIPAPNVDSAVIVCKRRTVPPVEVCDEKLFFKVVKAAFSVRRKMLSNALKNMGISSVQAAAWLERAGIDPKRRGETLSLADFASLTNCFKEVLAETEQ